MQRSAVALSLALLLPVGSAAAQAPLGFEECAERVAADPDDLEAYHCYWRQARHESRPREALAALDALARGRGEDPRIDLYRAAILGDLGRREQLPRLEAAAAGCESMQEWACVTLAQLSLAWQRRADTAAARRALAAAERAAEESGDPTLAARVRIGKGWRAIADEDFVLARAHLLAALGALEPDGPYDARYQALDGLGFVAWSTSRLDEAAELYDRSVALAEEAGDAHWAASARHNLLLAKAAIDAERGTPGAELTTKTIEDAVEEARRVGNRSAEAGLRLLLAQALREPERRSDELAESARVALAAGDMETAAFARWVRADDLASEGRFDEAMAEIERSTEAVSRSGSRDLELRLCLTHADLLWQLGLAAEGRTRSVECLTLLDRVLERHPIALDRAGLGWHYIAGAYALSQQLAGEGEIDLALAVIERLRIGSVLAGWVAEGDDSELAGLRREIAALQEEMTARRREAPELRESEQRLEELEAREQERLVVLGALPERALAIPTVDELRGSLDERTAILSFQISPWSYEERPESWSWVAVIDGQGARAEMLPHPQEIAAARRAFGGLLARSDDPMRSAAASLYRLLFADVLARLPSRIDRLVIVPDGPLHELPLAALRPTASAHLLGEQFEIVRAPSLAAWLESRRRAGAPLAGRALSLADPTLPSSAEVPARDRLGAAELAGLGRLASARREAGSLRRAFGESAVVLLDAEASEASLKRTDLAGVGLLHVAAHAVVDPLRPYRSAVLLAPGGGEDGLLQLRDVTALELDGAIVVLAACRSADGSRPGGRGVFSLARAFLDAGASAVVANLEPVADADSHRLLEPFFRELARGAPVGAALAHARRRLATRYPPAAWATTVLLGDGEARLSPVPRRPLRLPSTIVAAALLLAALLVPALLWRRQR